MNKETLEEAIGNYIYSNYDNQPLWEIIENAVKFGSKWQQERMYSEEEVDKMFETLKLYSVKNVATITNVDLFISSWKREFKKK